MKRTMLLLLTSLFLSGCDGDTAISDKRKDYIIQSVSACIKSADSTRQVQNCLYQMVGVV